MVRKKDPFWQYVEIQNGRRSCKFCRKRFSGGISRFKSHLAGVTCRDIKICRKVPENVKSAAIKAIDASNKAKGAGSPRNVVDCAAVSNSSSSSRQSIGPIIYETENKRVVDRQLAMFLGMNHIPFEVTESPSLIKFVKGVAEFGPDYELPSCSSFQAETILDLEEEVDKYVIEVDTSFEETGGTLIFTREGPYYSHSRWIVAVACTTRGAAILDKIDCKDGDYAMACNKLVAARLRHGIQLIIDPILWLCDTIHVPDIFVTRCASVAFKNLLDDILRVEVLKELVCFARIIFTFIYKHKVNLFERIECKRYSTKDRFLNELANRILMLQSILEVENELKELGIGYGYDGCSWCVLILNHQKSQHIELAKLVGRIICCNDFWRLGKALTQLVQPLFQAMHLVNDYLSTSGYLYEAFERAKTKLEEFLDWYGEYNNDNNNNNSELLDLYQKHRERIISPMHKAAAFLNPAYMLSDNFNERTEIKEGINSVVETLVASEDKEAFVDQMQSYRKKDRRIFTSTAMIMLKTAHPRIWWEYCGDYIPVLRKYAIRILSQPCSGEPWKDSIDSIDEPLSSKKDDVFLYANASMMEKYNMLKEQDERPIELDKLSGLPEFVTLQASDFEYGVNKDWKDFIFFLETDWEDFMSSASEYANRFTKLFGDDNSVAVG